LKRESKFNALAYFMADFRFRQAEDSGINLSGNTITYIKR
jgi:hypothetical protein